MVGFLKKYKKRIALIYSLVLFVLASGYTSIFSLQKSITVELNERYSAFDEAEIRSIDDANLNKSIREVLEENDLPTDDQEYVYDADLDNKVRTIDALTINRKVSGTLTADGEVVDFTSGGLTVGDVMNELGIRLSQNDSVEPTADTALTSESANIIIHRQEQQRETREESIKYKVYRDEDPNLEAGKVEVDIPGSEGRKLVTEDVMYRDGSAIKRDLVEETVMIEPIDQIERIGTKKQETVAQSQPTTEVAAAPESDDQSSEPTRSSGLNETEVPSSGTTITRTVRTIRTTQPGPSGGYYTTDSDGVSSPSSSGGSVSYGNNGTSLSNEDFDLVCAIVEHEGGSSYEGALAVMSCVMNRVDAGGYGDDPVSVLTAPGQFASYLDGYYQQFLGNTSVAVEQAVRDCLNGKRSHNYLNFRSYQTSGSENIGGNWFF